MKVKKKLYVELTKEEREILKKAQDILVDFEAYSSSEEEEDLQALYDNHIAHFDHDFALPTAIDLIGAILDTEETDNEV